MLRSLKELVGYDIVARDGKIGRVHDFYFDDKLWTVRYTVADVGDFLRGKYVLLAPASLKEPDWNSKAIEVQVTKETVENSPGVDENMPVSRQKEQELMQYYQWPNYWATFGAHVPETAIIMSKALAESKAGNEAENANEKSDPHLRSALEVNTYRIQASDGQIGHVEDYIVDDQKWILRYLVVDTKNWLPWSKKVLIAPVWINQVDWSEEIVGVELSRDLIRNSPEFDPSKPVNREYEVQLYDYYGRPKYWE